VKVTVPVSNIPGKPFFEIALTVVVACVRAGMGPRVEGLAERATEG
jgi:hypothetical protein